MEMQALQALVDGQVQPEHIDTERLVALAKQQSTLTSAESELLEQAVNLVLIHYLKQAQAYL
jgi:mRNA-degrading endonuclease toxin of MazEF toxin-antitoxin module